MTNSRIVDAVFMEGAQAVRPLSPDHGCPQNVGIIFLLALLEGSQAEGDRYVLVAGEGEVISAYSVHERLFEAYVAVPGTYAVRAMFYGAYTPEERGPGKPFWTWSGIGDKSPFPAELRVETVIRMGMILSRPFWRSEGHSLFRLAVTTDPMLWDGQNGLLGIIEKLSIAAFTQISQRFMVWRVVTVMRDRRFGDRDTDFPPAGTSMDEAKIVLPIPGVITVPTSWLVRAESPIDPSA